LQFMRDDGENAEIVEALKMKPTTLENLCDSLRTVNAKTAHVNVAKCTNLLCRQTKMKKEI